MELGGDAVGERDRAPIRDNIRFSVERTLGLGTLRDIDCLNLAVCPARARARDLVADIAAGPFPVFTLLPPDTKLILSHLKLPFLNRLLPKTI